MREFKFRVWHKKENRWLDPWDEEDPILSLKDYGHGCEVFTYNRERKSHDNLDCLMTDVVIQQYTGLKDKNGKEIYEGDIVYCYFANRPDKENLGVVEFSQKYGDMGIKIIKNNIYVAAMDVPKPFFNFITNEGIPLVKVTGNIFENPELLK
jgi:uncharacterized phage protein (TIGR01671 family)